MNFLPIGSIVTLKEDHDNPKTNLMITLRLPLTDLNGQSGYFDYAGCIYPYGMLDDKLYYFNNDDIDEIVFKGYVNATEKELVDKIEKNVNDIGYKRLSNKKYTQENEDLSDLLRD